MDSAIGVLSLASVGCQNAEVDAIELKQAIGQRVMETRLALGLTQGQLAERCGLVDETISRIERGVQGVTIENLCKIASSLGVRLSALVDVENVDVTRAALVSEVAALLGEADEQTVRTAYRLMRALVAE